MLLPQQQGQHLANMISQASNAWGNELDSRVAQAREWRRMQHEQAMLAQREAAEMEKLRLEREKMRQEYELAFRQMRMQDAAKRGDTSMTLVPGRGYLPSWMT